MSSGGLYGSRVLLKREWCLLKLVAQGLKNQEIAALLSTTPHVVKNRLRVIYDKAGVFNRVELALWYEARLHFGEIPSFQSVDPLIDNARRAPSPSVDRPSNLSVSSGK